MSKQYIKFLFILTTFVFVSCAKRGTITGGDKDTIAPVLKTSFPKNYSVNFNSKEIKLVFDEYVKLKNVNKQLIISPPLKNKPEVLPLTASKTITIKLSDTLIPNTTYSFNFGQSIEDNNEGNPLHQFKYVFSTGNYIDSLKLKVKVKDALNKKSDSFVSVMLYEVNEKFNDSTIFKESPRYITNTLDSLKNVTIENIKPGKYQLIALKDNGNNKYDPKSDKIGFQKQFIRIPSDTIYELELFKEILPFSVVKPVQASGNRLIIGFEGNPKNAKVILKKKNEILPIKVTKHPLSDSLQIWYKSTKSDSLKILVQKENYKKDFLLNVKNQKNDTLKISSEFTGDLPLREKFTINLSTPLEKLDRSKIFLTNRDSIAIPYTTDYDEFSQKLIFNFKKEPSEKYSLTFLPNAITDFFDNTNKNITFSFTTRNSSDFGNLRIKLENIKKFPVLVELTNKEGKVKAQEYSENNPIIDFISIEPSLYTVRVIYDENKNRIWDPGNYIEKRQSEEVIYFPREIDVRANWDVEQVFNLP